ncbi:MAG: ribosome small subunit-dependent GTPase A, partial [Marivirga sp.]|nr:ribosome small subunit-dependent GTPase A [Marivirga sp.]
MTILNDYGWDNSCQDFYDKNAADGLSAGRIISIKGFRYSVIAEKGELETELSGRLLFGAAHEELPKVGDWVFFMDYGATGYITSVFPRVNELSRKHPGEKTERQILATNLDGAFIVQGLDNEFNLMRLERYLVQITSCGVRPVVLLNKADLIDNPERYRDELAKLSRDCPVHFCSTYSGAGVLEIVDLYMEKFKTY